MTDIPGLLKTGEPCREPERRSRAGLKWTTFRRRPVTAVVRHKDSSMPLVRSHSQGSNDIALYYKDRESDASWANERNARMRALISALNNALPKTIVYGLTSHDTLFLMSVPEYNAGPWFVAIDAMAGGGLEVTYRPPEGELPIRGSEIRFRVSEIDLATIQIKMAMALSGGWPDSQDLTQ